MRKDISTLQERFKAAVLALQELKNRQPAAGDGWRVYRSTTTDTYDINLSDVSAPYDRLFKITHLPDDGDNTEGFANFYYKKAPGGFVNLTLGGTYLDQRDPYSLYIRIYGSGGGGSKLALKFYVFSPKRGTLQITDTAP